MTTPVETCRSFTIVGSLGAVTLNYNPTNRTWSVSFPRESAAPAAELSKNLRQVAAAIEDLAETVK